MKDLLAEFQNSMQNLGIAKNHRLLLAVSGGLDSVVLTSLTALSGWEFSIAHVNFQLRAQESDRDEEFVHQLADKYKKPFFCKKIDTHAYAASERSSIQVVARKLRY